MSEFQLVWIGVDAGLSVNRLLGSSLKSIDTGSWHHNEMQQSSFLSIASNFLVR